MTLFLLNVFVVLYYLRLQDWVPLVSGFRLVRITNLLALGSLLFRKNALKLRDIFYTPHDYSMYLFSAYMILVVDNMSFSRWAPRFILYLLLTVSLDSLKKIRVFIRTWMLLLVGLSLLAVLPYMGLDPTESLPVIEGPWKERLAINISLYNNPNALGHSVYPAIMLIYFSMIWKREITLRVLALPMMALPIWCVYATLSKGAFICGALSVAVGFVFGRSRSFQIFFGIFVLLFGVGAVRSLPRMDELRDVKNDDAIYYRILASQAGLEYMANHPYGMGYGTFYRKFAENLDDFEMKASHSSFVQIASETGKPGLVLFLILLYCSLRVILFAKCQTDEEERIRRVLFCLLIGWMASSWMVDFFPRNEWVMIAGVCAAYHRVLLRRSQPVALPQGKIIAPDEAEEGLTQAQDRTTTLRTRRLHQSGHQLTTTALQQVPDKHNQGRIKRPLGYQLEPDKTAGPMPDDDDLPPDYNEYEPKPRTNWKFFNWIDLVAIILMVQLFMWFWKFSINRMLSI